MAEGSSALIHIRRVQQRVGLPTAVLHPATLCRLGRGATRGRARSLAPSGSRSTTHVVASPLLRMDRAQRPRCRLMPLWQRQVWARVRLIRQLE